MKLSYRSVFYESDTSRRLLERETTAKYRGVDYVIQHFGEKLPAPEPNLKYRGANCRQCLSATQAQSRHPSSANFAESDFFSEFIE